MLDHASAHQPLRVANQNASAQLLLRVQPDFQRSAQRNPRSFRKTNSLPASKAVRIKHLAERTRMTSSRNCGNLKELLQIEVSKPQQDFPLLGFVAFPTRYASTTVLAYIVYISKPRPASQAFFKKSCKGEVFDLNPDPGCCRFDGLTRIANGLRGAQGGNRGKTRLAANERK